MDQSLTTTSPKCLFCEHQGFKSTPFEDTVFNNKTFQYIQCTNCGLVQSEHLALEKQPLYRWQQLLKFGL